MMKRTLSLTVLIIVLILTACGGNHPVQVAPMPADTTASIAPTATGTTTLESTATPAPAVIEDMLGRSVTLPAKVERVAGAGPGALRLIVYLQAMDMVAGIEEAESRWGSEGRPYIMAHPELKDHPTIGPGGPGNLPDMEALVQLRPDVLFITYVDARTADNIQDKTGVPVVVLNYGDNPFGDELLASLELAGRILGKEGRAREVVSYIRQSIDDLKSRTTGIPETERVRAYAGGISFRGAQGIESTESQFALLAAVNAYNVADEPQPGHRTIDPEMLVKWDPEVIFIDEGGLELVIQDYAKNPGFYRSLSAVKNGRLYGFLPYNYYTTNVETALADTFFIGKVLYPALFEDIDPVAKADEIYSFFVGKPLYADMAKVYRGFGVLDLEAGKVQ